MLGYMLHKFQLVAAPSYIYFLVNLFQFQQHINKPTKESLFDQINNRYDGFHWRIYEQKTKTLIEN